MNNLWFTIMLIAVFAGLVLAVRVVQHWVDGRIAKPTRVARPSDWPPN